MTSSRLLLGLTLACLTIAGCSDGAEGGKRATVYKVTGKVTLLGGPLIGATVAFGPKETQPVAIGRTDDEGNYFLTTYEQGDGAAAGNYSVTVSRIVAASSTADPASAAHGVNVKSSSSHNATVAKSGANDGNLVPAKYADSASTPLSFKVEEKDNVYNIDIK